MRPEMDYITGDIYGDLRDLICFSEAHPLTFEDTIIILGDAMMQEAKDSIWMHKFRVLSVHYVVHG